MSHPFGDLVWNHLIRKRGLSQNKLAMGINQDPAVIARMCNGRALTGPQSRERIVQIIEWLHEQGVLEYLEEANALLAAADKPGLAADSPREARLRHTLKANVAISGVSSVGGTALTGPTSDLPGLAGWPQGRQAAQTQPTPPSPYRGLFAFREEDAAYFCGREAFTERLVEAVDTRWKPLVAVIGPSGSGKSSAVFAGLVPRLRKTGGWVVASFRPTDRPFQALAAALVPLLEPQMSETERLIENNKLAEVFKQDTLTLQEVVRRVIEKHPPAKRLLLVADQFEELYTLCQDTGERQTFLDFLLTVVPLPKGRGDGKAARPPELSVVVTLRADFLGPALSYRPMVDALQGTDLKLGSMTREELQAAIELPARQLGVRIEDGLTRRILDAVSDEPGDLPLLEFALTLLWARQRNRMLTHAAYDDIGGVERALAGYAEERYAELSEEEQERARHIFLQLVQPGEATEDIRRLASREEVREDNWDLVTRLANDRLVVSDRDEATGEDMVEIAHEALIAGWDRLREWVDTDRKFRTWQERMRAALHQWEESGRDEGALLRGALLAEAEHWLEERAEDLSLAEQNFIQAGVSLREWERDAEERRKEHELELARHAAVVERQAANRLRYLLLALALVAILGIFLTTKIQEATVRGRVSEAERLGFEAGNVLAANGSSELFALLTVRSGSLESSAQGDKALAAASVLEYPSRRFRQNHMAGVTTIAFSKDGKRAITGSYDTTARIWDMGTGEQIGLTFTQTGKVRGAVFAPIRNNPNTVMTASSTDHAVRLWDLSNNNKPVWEFNQFGDAVVTLAMSGDGGRVVAGSEDNTAWIIDVESVDVKTGKGLHPLKGHAGFVRGVAFSPDNQGKYIATGSSDKTARIWDGKTGAPMGQPFTATDPIICVAFSPPGGRFLLTGGEKASLQLWDIQSQKEVTPGFNISGLTGIIQAAAFSPDGKYIVTGGDDHFVRLWDVATRREVRHLILSAPVTSAAFFPSNGNHLWIGTDAGEVLLWDLGVQPANRVFAGHSAAVQSAVFSTKGDRILTTSSDGTARVWDTISGREVTSFTQHTAGLTLGAFSPDPDSLMALTGSFEGSARLWDMTGREVFNVMGRVNGEEDPEVVYGVAFSKDGKQFLTAGWDGKARLWDVGSKMPKQEFPHRGEVYTAVFSQDGLAPGERNILTASSEGAARLWDLRGNMVYTFTHPAGVFSAVFSHDGKYILTAAAGNGQAYVWKATKPWDSAPIRVFRGPEGNVQSARFSPDDRYVVTAHSDSTVRLWNAQSGQQLRVLAWHTAPVESAEFSPDGKYILTASDDNTARLWDFDYHTTVTNLCKRLSRDFTPEERTLYGITDNNPTCRN